MERHAAHTPRKRVRCASDTIILGTLGICELSLVGGVNSMLCERFFLDFEGPVVI